MRLATTGIPMRAALYSISELIRPVLSRTLPSVEIPSTRHAPTAYRRVVPPDILGDRQRVYPLGQGQPYGRPERADTEPQPRRAPAISAQSWRAVTLNARDYRLGHGRQVSECDAPRSRW